jgi:hypothetical protein
MPFSLQNWRANIKLSAFCMQRLSIFSNAFDLSIFPIDVAVVVRNLIGCSLNMQHRPKRGIGISL